MNVVVIGSGGREHALVKIISESKSLKELYALPGNPGTEKLATNLQIAPDDKEKILQFCINNNIDLVVIGPEQPLVEGLSDLLREHGINVFGPDKNAAQIEGDKSFAKKLMQDYNIPTAKFRTFDKKDYSECVRYLDSIDYPTVVKASGLAAGKGVIICNNKEEALKAIDGMFKHDFFGVSGHRLVIEEFMVGQEASIFAITDGDNYVILPSSQDHKRIFDGDRGKNTGGMGAYAPAPVITKGLLDEIDEKIIKRTIDALKKENRKYIGCLYAGLMITEKGPKVVEFNCRFGDPETQAVLPIIDGDFLELLHSASTGKVNKDSIQTTGKCAICVITASEGYPDKYEKGFEISGLDMFNDSDSIVIYHAGTKIQNDKILTNGGRVLGITAVNMEGNLPACKTITYRAIDKIEYKGKIFRKDISDKAYI